MVVVIDVMVNTQGLLYFAPKEIYNPVGSLYSGPVTWVQELHNPQVRFMTRNSNKPYTDYGMYWEASHPEFVACMGAFYCSSAAKS